VFPACYRVNLQVPNPLSTSANSPFLNATADGILFTVRCAGRYVLGGGPDYQMDLLFDCGGYISGNNLNSVPLIATTGLQQAASSPGIEQDVWGIEARLLWDANS
jgi:hypothetical protein